MEITISKKQIKLAGSLTYIFWLLAQYLLSGAGFILLLLLL